MNSTRKPTPDLDWSDVQADADRMMDDYLSKITTPHLICRQCGCPFDSIEEAASHQPGACGSWQGFDLLLPEADPTCWCEQPATHVQPADICATPGPYLKTPDGQPGTPKCDEHVTDSAWTLAECQPLTSWKA